MAGWGYIRSSAAHRTASVSFDSHKLKATVFAAAAECHFTVWLNGKQGYINMVIYGSLSRR
jgi:hypothetical protein